MSKKTQALEVSCDQCGQLLSPYLGASPHPMGVRSDDGYRCGPCSALRPEKPRDASVPEQPRLFEPQMEGQLTLDS